MSSCFVSNKEEDSLIDSQWIKKEKGKNKIAKEYEENRTEKKKNDKELELEDQVKRREWTELSMAYPHPC